tara:strand:- start:249 stop:503 length:255 start_codon:yes stop_codon:yes gene_type:complete
VVRDVAILSVICIGPDQRHRILGVSCALPETKVNWQAFFESLLKRGMSGVKFVVSDNHSGSKGGDEGRVWVGCVATWPVQSGAE